MSPLGKNGGVVPGLVTDFVFYLITNLILVVYKYSGHWKDAAARPDFNIKRVTLTWHQHRNNSAFIESELLHFRIWWCIEGQLADGYALPTLGNFGRIITGQRKECEHREDRISYGHAELQWCGLTNEANRPSRYRTN